MDCGVGLRHTAGAWNAAVAAEAQLAGGGDQLEGTQGGQEELVGLRDRRNIWRSATHESTEQRPKGLGRGRGA